MGLRTDMLAVQIESPHHAMPEQSDAWQILLLLAALLLLTLGVRHSLRQRTDPGRVTAAQTGGWTVPWTLILGVVAMGAFIAVVAL